MGIQGALWFDFISAKKNVFLPFLRRHLLFLDRDFDQMNFGKDHFRLESSYFFRRYKLSQKWRFYTIFTYLKKVLKETHCVKNHSGHVFSSHSLIKRELEIRNSRLFLTPNIFVSDCRVGQIRPPGSNFEQFWYSRIFKKNS